MSSVPNRNQTPPPAKWCERFLDKISDVLYRYDFYPKRGFSYVSPSTIDVTGYTPQEHYDDPDIGLKLCAPEDLQKFTDYLFHGKQNKGALILKWVKKDGTPIWTEHRNSYIYDENNNIIAAEGIARDITERIKAEISLKNSKEQLRAVLENRFFKGSKSSDAYPLISMESRSVATPSPLDRRIDLRFFQRSEEELLIEQAVLAAERGLCVLWICNTVANSQSIFSKINAERKEDSFHTGLLHSRFPAFRRTELEDDWMESLGKNGDRPKGCILVATQVVEQSVDIDADLLITELAPTDMLLQRMGRLCRHERKARPDGSGQAWIYGPMQLACADADSFKEALGTSHYIYAPYVLWKTIQVWKTRTEVNLPSDIRNLLETTYAERDELPEWVEELKVELDTKRAMLKGKALGLTKIYCGEDDEDSAATRYNHQPTIQALILKECDDCGILANLTLCNSIKLAVRAGERDFKTAVAVHQNMVTLPWYEEEYPATPAWLRTIVFGEVLVLKIRGEDLIGLDGSKSQWGYHPDKGVYQLEKEQ